MLSKAHFVLLIPATAVVASVILHDAYNYTPQQETVVETHNIVVSTKSVAKSTQGYWSRFANETDMSMLYRVGDKLSLSSQDIRCLALNIFHEAALEPFIGKLAVAQVTHNRLENGRWGSTWCDVVYAPAQFSWTLSKRKREMDPTGKNWQESVEAAYEYAINGLRIHGLEKSKYYHATWMERYPNWAESMIAVREVGKHVFYVHEG